MKDDNPVEALVEEIGKEETQYLMGVHHNTLYKWLRDPSLGGRKPPQATRRLAELLLHLIIIERRSLTKLKQIISDIDK